MTMATAFYILVILGLYALHKTTKYKIKGD
jgi:hypothetical protein